MTTYTALEKIFLGCAIFGGVLLAIRLILQFIAGVDHSDADAGGADIDAAHVDGDVHDAGVHDGVDSDVSFKLLTFQGITAFVMMFGLVGFAMLRQSGSKEVWAVLAAIVAGVITVWVIDKLFRGMGKMQSVGTINLNNAVGQEGEVYLGIKPGSNGKVRVTVDNRLRVLEATSESNQEIPTGSRIRVERVINGNVMVVTRIEATGKES